MPAATTQPRKRPAIQPLINEEADRALGKILITYNMFALVVVVVMMVLCGYLAARFPHDKLLQPNGPLFFLTALLCLVPFYFGQNKQAAVRLNYGRTYLAEGRTQEAIAALESFASFGQRSFDRTGEGHYLLAQAYERSGSKDKAAKTRSWLRKYRPNSDWTKRLLVTSAKLPARAAQLRRKTESASTETLNTVPMTARTSGRKSISGQPARKSRRRF